MEGLTRENGNVIDTIFKHVDEYLKANIFDKDQLLVTQLYRDDNLVVDSMPVEILNDLRESARLMVAAGLKKDIYLATSHRIDGFHFWKSLDIYPASARTGIEAFRFDKSLGILRDLLNLTYCVKEQAIARLHRITLDVLNYSEMMYHDWRSSWNKILNLLKLDIDDELEPNVAAELMKNELRSFSEL
ncbi:hypothetical protein glysoja_029112 [Glycine soja]|uniref:Uncharacterized protein n=1 Tax=Glycine soja TaxID=3848 RepID=A0A0B2QCW5_GLYSO|nr:hypothetical protein glysoja_029112 [Glycine soja]